MFYQTVAFCDHERLRMNTRLWTGLITRFSPSVADLMMLSSEGGPGKRVICLAVL